MDCISCVFLHDCPITILENKYLHNSITNDKLSMFKNANILYKCDHQYEQTVEFLVNVFGIIFCKINVLILMKLFRIQIIQG